MFHEFFTFKPTSKLWLLGNRKPAVRDTGPGLWRRVLLIPFRRQFLGVDADKRLGEKLQKEAAGILRWAVEGCLHWQAAGLAPPPVVEAATEEYRVENDALGRFLAEATVDDPTGSVPASLFYTAYARWCANEGIAEPKDGD